MDSLPVAERVAIGKEWEPKVINCLNGTYSKYGYNLRESSFHEDCKEKTDCWQLAKSGKPLRSAIKVRLNKNGELETNKTDILVALFDPFYGLDDERTKKGRDMVYEYFMYISLIKDWIRVANGKKIHEICDAMWNDFLPQAQKKFRTEADVNRVGWVSRLYQSPVYPGCEIWLHHDAKSKKPKLLGFVKPSALDKKDLRTHKYTEE